MTTAAPSAGPAPARGVFLRSFLVQASWNFKGMQNLGFAFMTIPAMKGCSAGDGEPAGRECLAQTDFFNTHPYLAGGLAGVALSLRESTPVDRDYLGMEAEAKETFMGPMAAAGDDFFWAGLRPLTGAAGIILVMAGFPLAGVAAFLALYNFWHLRARWRSVRAGLMGQEALLQWLRAEEFPRKARRLRAAAAVLFIIMPLFWIVWRDRPWPAPAAWQPAIAAATAMPLLILLAGRLDPRRAALALFLGAAVVFELGGIWR